MSYQLQFLVGTTTSAPGNGDSILYHSSLADKDIALYRGTTAAMSRQYINTTSRNGIPGYRVSNDTVIVRPVFSTGDRVLAVGVDSIRLLSFSSTDLTTSLSGHWRLNEPSGSTFYDETSHQNGTTYGTSVAQAGILNYCQSSTGTTAASMIPYDADVVPNGAFSFSLWVRLTTLPSVKGHSYTIIGMPRSTAPYNPHYIQIRQSDNKVRFVTSNTSEIEYDVESSGALSVDTWYHIVAINPASGTLKLYINGSDVSTAADTWSGTVYTTTPFLYCVRAILKVSPSIQ